MRYDCVIVGAGSTGCVLAARLSEEANRTVLLLEAGRDFPDVASMPPALSTAPFDPSRNPEYLWNYAGAGTSEQRQPLAVIRGKVVGGSGAVNGGNFIRNVPEDFDSWGSDLWSFEAVLPFFRKLENDQDFTGVAHGTDGPIPVGRCPRDVWSPFHAAFYDSALACGFPEKPDLNHFEGSGVGPLPRNDTTGIRMNSALAYLNPVRHRENLTVQPNVLVHRVLFGGQRASHVEALIDGQLEKVEAGEIVLCAGGIESPHLLMLSGIGPAEELKKLEIPVVADVPGVGQNLTDHGTVGVAYADAAGQPLHAAIPQPIGLIYTAADSPHRNDMRIQPSVGFPRPSEQSSLTVARVTLDRPTNSGRLEVRSSDPTVPPTLDYRYLDNAFDRQRMREAVRNAIRIVESDRSGSVVSHRLAPLDSDLSTDKTLDTWIMHNFRTAFHTCGTAKLGDAKDEMAVVDERCRVRGVDGLRVADLSIMPTVGRASMNPTAIMIGERVAALLTE